MRLRGCAHLLHRGPSAVAGVGAFALLLALGLLDFVRRGLLLVIMVSDLLEYSPNMGSH
jgi:hypothetical protein